MLAPPVKVVGVIVKAVTRGAVVSVEAVWQAVAQQRAQVPTVVNAVGQVWEVEQQFEQVGVPPEPDAGPMRPVVLMVISSKYKDCGTLGQALDLILSGMLINPILDMG